jgi:hypothetical protein
MHRRVLLPPTAEIAKRSWRLQARRRLQRRLVKLLKINNIRAAPPHWGRYLFSGTGALQKRYPGFWMSDGQG